MHLGFGGRDQSLYELARNQQTFSALGLVTAMAAYTATTGVGGPLLWNNTGYSAAGSSRKGVLAVILAVGMGITTASAAAVSIGIGGGVSILPTATTAIDLVGSTFVGGPAPLCNTYRIGTVATAATFFQPIFGLGTVALSSAGLGSDWIPLDGGVIVPPGCWASVMASATATTSVLDVGLLWAEIPI